MAWHCAIFMSSLLNIIFRIKKNIIFYLCLTSIIRVVYSWPLSSGRSESGRGTNATVEHQQ